MRSMCSHTPYPWLKKRSHQDSSRIKSVQRELGDSFFSTVRIDGKIILSKNHPMSRNPEMYSEQMSEKFEEQFVNSVGKRVKLLAAQYGSLAVTFHVAISLAWLGATYSLVSYGLDLASWVTYVGLASEGLQAKLAGGASTFVVAYSIHKCFALVRLSITATCVPLLVRYFRRIGWMKQPLTVVNKL